VLARGALLSVFDRFEDEGLMNLNEGWLTLAQFGTEWVLWLLIGMSVVSMAVIAERAWFFARRRLDVDELARQLVAIVRAADPAKARAALARFPAGECQVLSAGLMKFGEGYQAAAAAIASARERERIRLECNLGLLSAVAASAPLTGVMGTLLGIIGLLDGLAQAPPESGLATPLLAGISVSLVTTAVGLVVAVPAVAAAHLFARRVRAALAQIDSLSQLALSHLPTAPSPTAPSLTAPSPEETSAKAA
jgi:biopolymer transport protein ExbB